MAWNNTLPAPTYCRQMIGKRWPSAPVRSGCSASTRAAGFSRDDSNSQYKGGNLAQISRVSSGVSPNCMVGLASPSSVG